MYTTEQTENRPTNVSLTAAYLELWRQVVQQGVPNDVTERFVQMRKDNSQQLAGILAQVRASNPGFQGNLLAGNIDNEQLFTMWEQAAEQLDSTAPKS